MDKEKEIEEMAKAMCKGCSMIECKPDEHCYVYPPAERAVNAGYGNIKQAVKEFAEKLEKLLIEHEKRYSHFCKSKKECHDETCRYQAILRLHKEITELYGADK